MHRTKISVTAFFLLWGAFFLEFQLPLVIGILMSIVSIHVGLLSSNRMDVIGVLTLSNIAYWLLSGLIVGSIGLTDLLNPKFYNGDGRILISLLPLLLFSLWSVTIGDLRRIIKTVLYMGATGFGLFAIWSVSHTSLLSGAGHADEFHGFMTSHTGAGTFFGTLCVFVLLFGYESRNKFAFILGVLLAGPVIGSGSREALLGIIIMSAWYLLIRNPKPRLVMSALLVSVVMISTFPYVSQKTFNRTSALVSLDFVQSTLEQAKMGLESDWAVGDWTTDTGGMENLEEGDVTSMVRILLWSYATRKLLDSPFFGLGWGRFNDTNLVLVGVPGLVHFAADGEQKLTTSNAHNSYFHVLSESGILGMGLLLAIWLLLYVKFDKAIRRLKAFKELKSYFVACQGLIVFALGCALTGHALASPSIMVPVLTILGAGMAFIRTNVKRASRDSKEHGLEKPYPCA